MQAKKVDMDASACGGEDFSSTPESLKDGSSRDLTRSNKGRILPGTQLGRGRKQGSKNKSTILREIMEEKVSIMLSKKTPAVVKMVIDKALDEQDLQAAKLILDRAISTKRAEEGGKDTDSREITITIRDLTKKSYEEDKATVTIEGEVIKREVI